SPFDPPPPKDYKGRWGGELRNVVWVKPEVVIRAELGGWTRDGIVRQAAFKGFDEGGKPPTQVVRERPVEAKQTVDAVEAALPEPVQDDPVTTAKAKRAAPGGRRDAAAGGRSPRPSANPSTASVRAGRGSGPRGRSAPAAASHEFPWEATTGELAALDAMTKDGTWEVGGFELKVTNLDKVIFPPKDGAPVTKRDLIRYFALIAPTMLPHLQERALNFQRFPNGPNAPGFWQKD